MPRRTELEAFLRHLLPWQVKRLEPAAVCATDWPELRDLRTHAAWTWMHEPDKYKGLPADIEAAGFSDPAPPERPKAIGRSELLASRQSRKSK